MRWSAAVFVLAVFGTMPVGSAQAVEWGAPQHAIAMTGTPVYPEGFSSFSFVNPDAPKGGTLKIGAVGTFDSLNPFIVRGQAGYGLGTGVLSVLFERLMAYGWDEPFALYGHIAQTVEVATDRSGIIFNLNPKARFSDGTSITAEDVKFSHETLRDKGRPNHRTYYKKVESVEILGPHRIKFMFKKNAAGEIDREMPLILGYMFVLPKHDWEGREFNQTTLKIPVGSGPYTIKEVDVGRRLVYERNPNYWAKDRPECRGLYNFDTIVVDYYRDDSIALEAFKAGQFDVRTETSPTKWATAYDFPAVEEGRVRLEHLEYKKTEPAYGYILNTRRSVFADPVLREALQHTFNFAWVNKALFYGQFKRVDSFFANSELAARGLPKGRELEILSAYKDKLDPKIFTTPVGTLTAEAPFRAGLLKAEKVLRKGGYRVVDDVLFDPSGKAVTFEVLLSDPVEEKVALNWAASLKRLGIVVRIHTVDSAQYQARLSGFDYDVTANRWINSLSPGNEQMYLWGSAAADQRGSRNYAGVRDPVVDALAKELPRVSSREDLVATARALDRVLLHGNYFVPLYYAGAENIASWTRVAHPVKSPLYGNLLESWWASVKTGD